MAAAEQGSEYHTVVAHPDLHIRVRHGRTFAASRTIWQTACRAATFAPQWIFVDDDDGHDDHRDTEDEAGHAVELPAVRRRTHDTLDLGHFTYETVAALDARLTLQNVPPGSTLSQQLELAVHLGSPCLRTAVLRSVRDDCVLAIASGQDHQTDSMHTVAALFHDTVLAELVDMSPREATMLQPLYWQLYEMYGHTAWFAALPMLPPRWRALGWGAGPAHVIGATARDVLRFVGHFGLPAHGLPQLPLADAAHLVFALRHAAELQPLYAAMCASGKSAEEWIALVPM